jgi:hypothetical protein
LRRDEMQRNLFRGRGRRKGLRLRRGAIFWRFANPDTPGGGGTGCAGL